MTKRNINKANLIAMIVAPFAIVLSLGAFLSFIWGLGWVASHLFGRQWDIGSTWIVGMVALVFIYIAYQVFIRIILPLIESIDEFIHEESETK